MVVTVECFGMVPPCKRCKKLEENAKKAAEKLKGEGIEVEIIKKDIMDEEATANYGILMSPAVVINGVVKFNGKLPDHRVMERVIREAH
jgi:hypothetical protein